MKYYLAESCQNMFVLFDCRDCACDENTLKWAHRALISENRDDALLIANPTVFGNVLHIEMLVLGLDGTLAEFCGNGARAVAAYLFEGTSYETIFLKSKAGIVCRLKKGLQGTYALTLPMPSFAMNPQFITDEAKFRKECNLTFVEMLEPHLLINKQMSDLELTALGRDLNQKRDLFPHGINVNAWHPIKEGVLFVKTYERGVQRLTRSCGTGSASCAALCGQDVAVITPGGELKVTFGQDGLTLIGPAQFEPHPLKVK